MSIYNYEIINPVTNIKKPFYDFKRKLLFFPVNGSSYRYYVEVARNNKDTFVREYYVLLSDRKFDDNCRICHVDNYGRCQINPRGEIKDYVIQETKYRGNIEIEYVESEKDYDVFAII
jgi:hypothetical protein